MTTDAPPLGRPMPVISHMNHYFWCGGADGRLHIMRCGDCERWFHPYQAACAECGSRNVRPEAASGRGTVIATTINHQPWFPHVPVPYVFALVELEEKGPVRLATNLMTVAVEDARAGMAVQVYFEQHGDVFIPLFAPV
jgi:uncharacterized OB-fold protein